MAKIHEELIIIKLSKLRKDNDPAIIIAAEEIVAGLEQVAQELVGQDTIVEIIKEQ